MMDKKIYVIVVTYNGMKWINKCFLSLKNSSIPLNIIAIDNASTDESCDFIKENFETVNIIQTGSNLGFSKANNIGLKVAVEANADYIFLLNQDAWVEKHCIEKLVIYLENDTTFSLLSPYHYNYEGTGSEFYFEQYVLKYYVKDYNYKFKDLQNSKALEAKFVHAAAWMLPIKTVLEVGGFDPLFKHTGEDNDFIQRLQYKGLKAGILTSVNVCHQGTNAGLVDSEDNYVLHLNTILLKLKNPSASIGGAFWLFCLNTLRHIVSKNYKTKKFQKHIFVHVIRNVFKIIYSRNVQLKRNAYLN